VVYERRRAGMPEQDFTTGLRVMLRAFDGHRRWNVVPVDTQATFDEWVHGVDLVNRFRFRVEGLNLRNRNVSGPLGILLRPRPGALTIDFRSGDGVDVSDDVFKELVLLAESGAGEVLAVGRRSGQDSADVQKAWESASSAERVVQEVPLDEEESEAASESRLLEVLSTVPPSPSW